MLSDWSAIQQVLLAAVRWREARTHGAEVQALNDLRKAVDDITIEKPRETRQAAE